MFIGWWRSNYKLFALLVLVVRQSDQITKTKIYLFSLRLLSLNAWVAALHNAAEFVFLTISAGPLIGQPMRAQLWV